MKKLTTMLLISLISLTGCNTIEGLGKDIKKTGDVISNEARKTKSNM